MAQPAVSTDTTPQVAVSPVLDGNPLFELWADQAHGWDDFTPAYWETRKMAVRTYAYAVPAPQAIQAVRAFAGTDPVHEVAAGAGYWAAMLHAAGVQVVATDAADPTSNNWVDDRVSLYHPVGQADAVQAAEAAGRAGAVLLLVWPPYANSMATDATLAYAAAGGQRIVYVGEHVGGCTADDEFFGMFPDLAHDPDALFSDSVVEYHAVPNWTGVHDVMACITLNHHG